MQTGGMRIPGDFRRSAGGRTFSCFFNMFCGTAVELKIAGAGV